MGGGEWWSKGGNRVWNEPGRTGRSVECCAKYSASSQRDSYYTHEPIEYSTQINPTIYLTPFVIEASTHAARKLGSNQNGSSELSTMVLSISSGRGRPVAVFKNCFLKMTEKCFRALPLC